MGSLERRIKRIEGQVGADSIKFWFAEHSEDEEGVKVWGQGIKRQTMTRTQFESFKKEQVGRLIEIEWVKNHKRGITS